MASYLSDINIQIAEILDTGCIEMDRMNKRESILPIVNEFIIPQLGNIVGGYIDENV